MKRFYKKAEYKLENGTYYFYLDDKIIKTPLGNALSTLSAPKAQAVVAEWEQQQDTIVPHTMPVTKYLNSVYDKIMPNYDYIIAQLVDYSDTDCILFFSDKKNTALYETQQKYWLPVIHYFAKKYSVHIHHSTDFCVPKQSDSFKIQLSDFFKSLPLEDLAGLYTIITTLSSVLLGVYAYDKHIDYDTALEYSRLEEQDNIKNWGFDADMEKKYQTISQEYQEAIRFLQEAF